jgi:hypothetical protein
MARRAKGFAGTARMALARMALARMALVMLTLALPFGCARLSWDAPEQSAWYIQLEIGQPEARGIGVGEYPVTGLSIEVYAPGNQLLDTVSWDAQDGPTSHVIPVSQAGTYRIEVTHIGDNGGEMVQATESTNFVVQAMVITVIHITPGAIGKIDVEGGGPEEPIDLNGFWDFYWTIGGQPEMGPVLFYIEQTGSELAASMGFSGSISGSAVTLEAWIDMGYGVPLYVRLEGTVSGSDATGYEIAGSASGDMGGGTFRLIYPSAAPFGHLDLLGQVGGVPISLDTEYALGSGGETDHFYNYSFSLYTDWLAGSVWFQSAGELRATTYTVTAGEPFEDDEIEVSLMVYPSCDLTGMAGSFHLSFSDGTTFSGEFNLTFGAGGPETYVSGLWNGSPVSESGVYSERHVWETSHFVVSYADNRMDVFAWISVAGMFEAGRSYQMPEEAWLSLRWLAAGQPGFDDFYVDAPGTLTITRYDEASVAGTIDMGSTLTGSFDVSFWEQWQPD